MNHKLLIKILWITTLGSASLVVGIYLLNFHSYKISSNSAEWGQFADYVGGLLNPILATLNLIVLTYLTLKISNSEDLRNRFTLQELARPLADIKLQRQGDGLEIGIDNCGLGPLRIRKILILHNGVEYDSYKKVFPAIPIVPANIGWEFWQLLEGEEAVLAKDKTLTLIKLFARNPDASALPYFRDVYSILYKTKLIIEYSDIYNRLMPSATFDFTKLSHPDQ